MQTPVLFLGVIAGPPPHPQENSAKTTPPLPLSSSFCLIVEEAKRIGVIYETVCVFAKTIGFPLKRASQFFALF